MTHDPRSPSTGTRARTKRPGSTGDGTRWAILGAAERLFAQQGIDAVSIRDITNAAQVSTSAIHYHFGSKPALVAAILDGRAADIGRRRDRVLDQLEARSSPTVRDVAQAIVTPTAELFADSAGEGEHYSGFVAAVAGHAELAGLIGASFDRYSRRLLVAYERAVPGLSEEVRLVRFGLAGVMVIQLYGQVGRDLRRWLARQVPDHGLDFTETVTDSVASILAGRRPA